jgi:hypothetical protein
VSVERGGLCDAEAQRSYQLTTERILTLHPRGKRGVNISRAKYEQVKNAIEVCLGKRGEATFYQLNDDVAQYIGDNFDGSIGRYYTSVKLDMEARGLIERISGTRPQTIRLTHAG